MDRIVLLFTLCVALAPRVANGACEVPEELKGGRPIDMVMGAGRQARGRITVNTVNDAGNIILPVIFQSCSRLSFVMLFGLLTGQNDNSLLKHDAMDAIRPLCMYLLEMFLQVINGRTLLTTPNILKYSIKMQFYSEQVGAD